MNRQILIMQLKVIIVIFSVILISSCTRKESVSLSSLLTEMTSRDNLTRLPSPWYQLKQFSSYDRRTVAAGDSGWFANEDFTQFIGIDTTQGRKEYIMFDSDGPGAVVRWWMTFAGAGASSGIVRVYIDNNSRPVVEDSITKVLSRHLLAGAPLSSSVSPETNYRMRGHNLYLPLPYSAHCRITYQCDSIRITANSRKPSIYYNICYRTYEKGTKVKSFSIEDLKAAGKLIAKTNETLLNPGQTAQDKKNETFKREFTVSPSDSSVFSIDRKNSAICTIRLKLSASDIEFAMRSTVLKMSFDGHRTVWVPAGDFFGTAYKKTSSTTWESHVDTSLYMETFWLMPFQKNCTLSLINYSNQQVDGELSIITSGYKWKNNSMYFGASWHEYHHIKTAGSVYTGGTGKHCDINFADIKGEGVYAGDAVAVYNTVDAWWGEGDEKIYVDGESFPSSIGTGTEDYYGYAWCRPELFSHPFIAQPSGSGNFHRGLSINMRYRNLDAIPFKSSVRSDIELWHWLPAVINYALTTYWYVKPPYEINIHPDPQVVALPLPPVQEI
jgi:hypothetical protein